VAPEKLTSYEIGYKRSAGPWSLDAAAYYYDYKDLQVSIYTGGTAQIINAANARVSGLEGQVRWDVTPGLQLSVGASYIDSEYRDFTNSPRYIRCADQTACGAFYGLFATVEGDSSGFRMQQTPEFTGNLGLRYAFNMSRGSLALSGNLYYTSRFYFDTSQQFPQDSYELLSLRAEWTDPSDRYTFALYGDNVTDAEYRTMAEANNFGVGAGWGSPPTIGASIRAKF
jgi:iron complex outermembrane receptor protein